MIRLSSVNVNKAQPNQILNRKLVENSPLVTLTKRGDDLIQIKCNSEFCLFTKDKQPSVADKNEIKNSTDYQFVDMYPIFPTIDLKDEHVYKPELNLIGVNEMNLHTFFHIDNDKLSDEINTSRLIMFAFGQAYAKSKLLQQNKVFK